LGSLKKLTMNDFKLFTVKAGDNSTKDGFPTLIGNSLSFAVAFNENCLYDVPEPYSYAYSKVYGFKEGIWYDRNKNDFVDRYSARLGFRPVKKRGIFQLAPYVHYYNEDTKAIINLGSKDPEVVYEAKPKETIYCNIDIIGDKYVFYIMSKRVECQRGKGHWLRYTSRMFIGGKFTLNHDASLYLKRLKSNL